MCREHDYFILFPEIWDLETQWRENHRRVVFSNVQVRLQMVFKHTPGKKIIRVDDLEGTIYDMTCLKRLIFNIHVQSNTCPAHIWINYI